MQVLVSADMGIPNGFWGPPHALKIRNEHLSDNQKPAGTGIKPTMLCVDGGPSVCRFIDGVTGLHFHQTTQYAIELAIKQVGLI